MTRALLIALVVLPLFACESGRPEDPKPQDLPDSSEPLPVDPSLCVPGGPCLDSPPSVNPEYDGYLLLSPDALGQLCLTGSGFGESGTLHFAQRVVRTLIWRDGLVCVSAEDVPSSDDDGRVWVESGGKRSNSFPFLTMPRVVGVTPLRATVGQVLTFEVENLGPERFLKFPGLAPEFVMAGENEVQVVATTPGLFCPEIRKATFKAPACVFAEVASNLVEGCRDTRQNGCTLTGVFERDRVSIGGISVQPLEGRLQSRFRETYAWPEALGPGTWVVRVEGAGGVVEIEGTLVPGERHELAPRESYGDRLRQTGGALEVEGGEFVLGLTRFSQNLEGGQAMPGVPSFEVLAEEGETGLFRRLEGARDEFPQVYAPLPVVRAEDDALWIAGVRAKTLARDGNSGAPVYASTEFHSPRTLRALQLDRRTGLRLSEPVDVVAPFEDVEGLVRIGDTLYAAGLSDDGALLVGVEGPASGDVLAFADLDFLVLGRGQAYFGCSPQSASMGRFLPSDGGIGTAEIPRPSFAPLRCATVPQGGLVAAGLVEGRLRLSRWNPDTERWDPLTESPPVLEGAGQVSGLTLRDLAVDAFGEAVLLVSRDEGEERGLWLFEAKDWSAVGEELAGLGSGGTVCVGPVSAYTPDCDGDNQLVGTRGCALFSCAARSSALRPRRPRVDVARLAVTENEVLALFVAAFDDGRPVGSYYGDESIVLTRLER